MKKIITLIILLIIFGLTFTYQKDIINYIVVNFNFRKDIITYEPNEYKKNINFSYVQQTSNFFPENKQDILNIIYTVLNNGWYNFTFYCDVKYEECLTDLQELSNDKYAFSNINNFVHPYNSYNKIFINYNMAGEVEVKIDKLYTEEDIKLLNKEVDKILKEIINDNMTTREKILAIHDYIINNTDYDSERADLILNNVKDYTFEYDSHKATGPLIEGMALCGGYSDAMSIFLERLGVKNYKVSSTDHVWNLVYLDNIWYHLDLTWDDPIVNTNKPILVHNYFLVTTEELEKDPNNKHIFDKEIYIEAR